MATHWIALYAFNNDVSYFHSFGIEHITKQIEKFIGNKNIQLFLEYKHTFSNVWIFLYRIY